jgi:hypothetical protein
MTHGSLGWESRDLVIPMTIVITHWRHPDYVGMAARRAQPLIQAALQTAVGDGWQADEPTDFATLFSRSRVRTTNNLVRWRVDSVTIRLIRSIEQERLVPHG